MTETQDRVIGRIEGKLDRLIEDRAETAKAQAFFHITIENIKNRQENTGEKLEALLARLQKVEEPLAELSRWRERFLGALMVASFAAATIGGATALFWQKFVASVQMWV